MSIDFWTGNKSDGEMEICRIVMAQVAITGARAHSIIVIQCRLVSITVGVPTKYLPAIDGILNGLVWCRHVDIYTDYESNYSTSF